jgi:hypothetical protein
MATTETTIELMPGLNIVAIPKPNRVNGKNLKHFLKAKKVVLPPEVEKLIADTAIPCHAFYYSKDVTLIMFALTFDVGLIESLTGDAKLGKLFGVKGVAVRVIKCPKESFKVLKKYVAGLSAKSA